MSGSNEYHNAAVEIAGLKKDVEHVLSELQKLRGHVDKGLEKRERDVEKQFLALEARIQEKLDKIDGHFDNYTPITSFKPLTRWLTIIGAAVVTFIFSVALSLFNSLVSFWNSLKVPPQ